MDGLAGVRLRGLAVAFDRLAKAGIFVFNATSSNCISEVPCSLSSSSLLLKSAMRNSDPRVRIVFVYRFNSNFHSIFTLQVAGCDFQHGPIVVFPRIQPFGSDDFSSLGKVYSRHTTGSVNCEISSVSFCLEVVSDSNCCQESCISTIFASHDFVVRAFPLVFDNCAIDLLAQARSESTPSPPFNFMLSKAFSTSFVSASSVISSFSTSILIVRFKIFSSFLSFARNPM